MKTKKIWLIVPLLFIMFAAHGQENQKQRFKKLEWLVGQWIRTNSKPGQSGYETWTKVSDHKLSGKGVTFKGNETAFVENLELRIEKGHIFYVVSITGEEKPVYFKLTQLSDDGFICENPEHDFPKKISYHYDGKKISAVISGDGKSMDYDFVLIN